MRKTCFLLAIVVLLGLACSRPAVAQKYAFTNLGTLGGQSSFAYGINNKGHVVGWSLTPGAGVPSAFLYKGGKMTDLNRLIPTGSEFYRLLFANDVNEDGCIVGQANTFSGHDLAFLYDDGHLVNLGTFGGQRSEARAVSAEGKVVGWADTGDGETHAFLYKKGRMKDLGTLGGPVSVAMSINSRDEIVGAVGHCKRRNSCISLQERGDEGSWYLRRIKQQRLCD